MGERTATQRSFFMRPFEPHVGWSHSLWAKAVQRIRAAASVTRRAVRGRSDAIR